MYTPEQINLVILTEADLGHALTVLQTGALLIFCIENFIKNVWCKNAALDFGFPGIGFCIANKNYYFLFISFSPSIILFFIFLPCEDASVPMAVGEQEGCLL